MRCKIKERGSYLLNLQDNEALIFDGQHYKKINVPYLEAFDSKKSNEAIIKTELTKCARKSGKRLQKNVQDKNNEKINEAN